jgi:hypothetical protein
MQSSRILQILEQVASGTLSVESAHEVLRHLPFEDLEYAKVDHHRAIRRGYPETIFCLGKTTEQVLGIAERMVARGTSVLGTRATPAVLEAIQARFSSAEVFPQARCFRIGGSDEVERLQGTVCVVCAGTGDIPVAEEACVTLEAYGNTVQRVYDVGVAGLHRVLSHLDVLRAAHVIIVCAGMEGALPSVVSGLVSAPVIAVPTSVGYGASFQGLAALLGMLNSCASGVTVVNIDNGFGAAAAATAINRRINGLF